MEFLSGLVIFVMVSQLSSSEIRLKVIKVLEENPHYSQRQLASHLGISLGKVNYVVQSLIGKGLLKIKNFYDSPKKTRYIYEVTPQGLREKVRLTKSFLIEKRKEYDNIRKEIEKLEYEVQGEL